MILRNSTSREQYGTVQNDADFAPEHGTGEHGASWAAERQIAANKRYWFLIAGQDLPFAR